MSEPHRSYELADESHLIAAGAGYSDEQRAASLAEIVAMAQTLQGLPPWRLTPYTEAIIEAERALNYALTHVSRQPGADRELDALDAADRDA